MKPREPWMAGGEHVFRLELRSLYVVGEERGDRSRSRHRAGKPEW